MYYKIQVIFVDYKVNSKSKETFKANQNKLLQTVTLFLLSYLVKKKPPEKKNIIKKKIENRWEYSNF